MEQLQGELDQKADCLSEEHQIKLPERDDLTLTPNIDEPFHASQLLHVDPTYDIEHINGTLTHGSVPHTDGITEIIEQQYEETQEKMISDPSK